MLYSRGLLSVIKWSVIICHCWLGAADVAVRQQLSSLLFVKKICEAKIRTLKYGDGELPSLPSVRMLYITVAVPLESDIYVYLSVFLKC